MLCVTSRTDCEREGVVLSRQSARGALAGEARTARANSDLRPSGGESTRVPTGWMLCNEALVAWHRADFEFTLVGLTFDMRGAQKAQPFGRPLDGRVRRRG